MSHEVVFKADAAQEDQHLVFGEVYIPMVPDSDNEFMDAEGIRKMAYDFMARQQTHNIDTFHTNELSTGAHVVESFIARKGDPTFAEGSWVVGVYVPDDATWSKIKKGEINGFSMEAFVTKTPVQVELQLPATIVVKTMKAEEGDHHQHTAYVNYDDQGVFKGGITDIVNGHSHAIRRGTRTEKSSDGHAHNFDHIMHHGLTEVIE